MREDDEPEVRVTRSGEETERAGAELGASLHPGDVVALAGELGAGKTTYVRGALAALGVSEPVTSPTFVLGHLYAGSDGATFAHLDLFRLSADDDEDPGLLEPYFGPELISFVEWPEHGAPSAKVRVRLEHLGGDRRRITVERRG